MKKRIINYRLKIDNLLANPDKISKEEWKKILQEHLTQIAFFQHERDYEEKSVNNNLL